MAKLFISYARKDGTPFARELANRLRALDHTVFLDVDSIRVGESWSQDLTENIKKSHAIIVIVTAASNSSPAVYNELEQGKRYQKRIIPIQIEDTPLPPHLQQSQAIQFSNNNYDYILLEIERVLKPDYPFFSILIAVGIVIIFALGTIGGIVLWRQNRPVLMLPTIIPDPCPLVSTRPNLSPLDSGIGQIEHPANCSTNIFTTVVETSGSYTTGLEDWDLWVLVYTDGRYWPQSIDACQQSLDSVMDRDTDSWHTTAFVDAPNHQYDLVLVASDPNTLVADIFLQELAEGCTAEKYRGFLKSELPSGLIEVDSVTIKTG